VASHALAWSPTIVHEVVERNVDVDEMDAQVASGDGLRVRASATGEIIRTLAPFGRLAVPGVVVDGLKPRRIG